MNYYLYINIDLTYTNIVQTYKYIDLPYPNNDLLHLYIDQVNNNLSIFSIPNCRNSFIRSLNIYLFPFFIDSKDQQRFIEAIVIEIGCIDHNQELEGPQLEIDLSTVPVQSGAHLPHRLYLHLQASYYIQAVSQNLKQIGSFL